MAAVACEDIVLSEWSMFACRMEKFTESERYDYGKAGSVQYDRGESGQTSSQVHDSDADRKSVSAVLQHG